MLQGSHCLYTSLAGMNLGNMSKCLKCAGNDDIITLKVRFNYTDLHLDKDARS